MSKPDITIKDLVKCAEEFCDIESKISNSELFGVNDGKTVGTHIELKFKKFIQLKFNVEVGSAASGIDLPSEKINTDIKVTSIKQPQSSCPFKDAKQKIFGLGYNLLLFVYDKIDDPITSTSNLNFVSCSFIEKERTADYTTTYRLRQMIQDGAIKEDLIAYLIDRNIPADEFTLNDIAEKVLIQLPMQGYLTISNALQWRLQYQRIVDLKDNIEGINKIVNKVKK